MAKQGQKKALQAIDVRFFGNFQVLAGGVVVNESSSRARRPWSLLQYLMAHRRDAVSRQQLIEALWPDGASEQPDKALKNLVYRVRSAFAAKGLPFAQEVVLYRGGGYSLNNELPWRFDFERFEGLYERALDPTRKPDDAIADGLAAIDLYRGDFLADQAYEDWVMPQSAYYRSIFFKLVGQVLGLLEDTGRDGDIEMVCHRALAVDQFEEGLHLAYINALVRQGKKADALAHYNKMADLFFREMGVTPSDELREVYRELSQSLNSTETDLVTIKDALSEHEVNNDAFYCDFEVFRSLYRLEARAAERSGQAVFVGLLTLNGPNGKPPEGDVLNKSMVVLLTTIHQSLRRGDVVSRFSLSQYILMLPTVTVENAEMVLRRVADCYAKHAPYPEITLHTRIQPLDPVMP